MKNMKYCQCCAMPIEENSDIYGTNLDGSENDDYCKYCYEGGKFTADITMEEMIEACVPHMVAANKDMTEDTARSLMKEVFPKLKRWEKR